MSVIKIENLRYYYPESEQPALDGIDLEINEGEFVLLLGGSGSGKSSLVKVIAGLIPEFYGGRIGGTLYLDGKKREEYKKAEMMDKVGVVFQDPESQLIMSRVEEELAFGLENQGLDINLMKRRIMEVAGALDLHPFLNKRIHDLSGGIKQKVVLASVLAGQPDILVLDEPTSQLDPIAGEEILTVVRRMNEENGITVILIEQRLERCFHLADRFLVMDNGKIILNTTNRKEIASWALVNEIPYVPPLMRLFSLCGFDDIPLTVKEGRKILRSLSNNKPQEFLARRIAREDLIYETSREAKPVVEFDNTWYTYKGGDEALHNVSFSVYPGEFLVVMGENAAGKTTLLKTICGLLKPVKGNIRIQGRDTKLLSVEQLVGNVGYLSQNPDDYLFLPTVREEIMFTRDNLKKEDDGWVDYLLAELGLEEYANNNPRDLSSGERQRVALASVLAAQPEIVLLDEPTRGLDYYLKAKLGKLLLKMQSKGTTFFVVTHDVEFAAEFAEQILLMTRGTVICKGSKYDVLTRSTFYSPQISKLFYNIDDSIVTMVEGERALRKLCNN